MDDAPRGWAIKSLEQPLAVFLVRDPGQASAIERATKHADWPGGDARAEKLSQSTAKWLDEKFPGQIVVSWIDGDPAVPPGI